MTTDTSPDSIRRWALEEAGYIEKRLGETSGVPGKLGSWRDGFAREAALFRAVAALAEREASRPSPSAKRVEAWRYGRTDLVRTTEPDDQSWTYLTHFPGVHDAASAAAFEQAVRGCMRALRVLLEIHLRGETPTDTQVEFAQRDADALAPYLPKTPR